MARSGVRRAVVAARAHSTRVAGAQARHPLMADVVGVGPLTVEPHGIDARLVEDDSLTLSQWVRYYDAAHTIDVGDTILVQALGDDEWVALEVIADKVAGPAPPTPPSLTWRGAWSAATAYAVNDAVSYLGSSYRRIVAGTTATAPTADTTNWAVLAAGGRPAVVTAFPGGAAAGDEVYLQNAGMAALTPPLMWHCRFNGTAWMALGCVPWLVEIDAYTTLSAPDRSVTSTTYVALAVAGPVIALPVLGWYHVELSFSAYNNTAGQQMAMSYDIGATAAVDVDSASFQPAVANTDVQRITRSYPKQFASAATLTCKYRVTGGTGVFRGSKTLKVTPVLLG
jgi:hypothetical protein